MIDKSGTVGPKSCQVNDPYIFVFDRGNRGLILRENIWLDKDPWFFTMINDKGDNKINKNLFPNCLDRIILHLETITALSVGVRE